MLAIGSCLSFSKLCQLSVLSTSTAGFLSWPQWLQ